MSKRNIESIDEMFSQKDYAEHLHIPYEMSAQDVTPQFESEQPIAWWRVCMWFVAGYLGVQMIALVLMIAF